MVSGYSISTDLEDNKILLHNPVLNKTQENDTLYLSKNFWDITLSELSLSGKDKYCMIPFIWSIYSFKTTEPEGRKVVAKSSVERGGGGERGAAGI